MKHPNLLISEPVVMTAYQMPHPIQTIQDARRLTNIQFRVLGRYDKLNRAGRPCSKLTLGNLAGTASAVIDHADFLPCHRNVDHGDIILINGELLDVADRFVIRLEDFYTPGADRAKPTALLPKDWVLPNFLSQLRTVVRHWSHLAHPGLKHLLAETFLDANNALGFLNAPGSLRFHHAYQGGLLDHTADMLRQLECRPWQHWRPIEKEIATVLIILHDIGKTVTLVGQGSSERGRHQPHEMAALELLAVPLARLESSDSQIANRIRGYFKPRNWHPRKPDPIYHVVASLDRASANISAPLPQSVPGNGIHQGGQQ